MGEVPESTQKSQLIISIRKSPICLLTITQSDFICQSSPGQAGLKFNLSYFSVMTLMVLSFARHSGDPSNCKASMLVTMEFPLYHCLPNSASLLLSFLCRANDSLGNHTAIPLSTTYMGVPKRSKACMSAIQEAQRFHHLPISENHSFPEGDSYSSKVLLLAFREDLPQSPQRAKTKKKSQDMICLAFLHVNSVFYYATNLPLAKEA